MNQIPLLHKFYVIFDAIILIYSTVTREAINLNAAGVGGGGHNNKRFRFYVFSSK